MSRKQFTAARLLDLQIAERVLGWKRGRDYNNGNGEWIQPPNSLRHRRDWEGTPCFTTRIENAMMLVGYMQTHFGVDEHIGFLLASTKKGFYCEFSKPSWGSASQKTLILAICHAALDAVKDTV